VLQEELLEECIFLWEPAKLGAASTNSQLISSNIFIAATSQKQVMMTP
jgi:hypothetical protein